MSVQIYHNPRCSKSRQTLALLQERGVEHDVISYLESAPSQSALKGLVAKLGLSSVREMMRTKEAVYKELSLKDETSEAALIKAVANNPILLERPIVVHGERAAIGRPPEAVLEIL